MAAVAPSFVAAAQGEPAPSVSYLAAPTFAAAMLEHHVLRTIPVGRHVLMIAGIRVAAGSDLAGRLVRTRSTGPRATGA